MGTLQGALYLPDKNKAANENPIRQLALKGLESNARVRPERTLLRFRVRRDFVPDKDVPLERAHQLGLEDASVDRAALAAGVENGQPLSEREILRVLDGTDTSGYKRAKLNAEVEACLLAAFHRGKRKVGYHLTVCALFSMVSRDQSFLRIAPEWLVELFLDERELLFDVFHNHQDDRRLEPGDSDDEDEEEDEHGPAT